MIINITVCVVGNMDESMDDELDSGQMSQQASSDHHGSSSFHQTSGGSDAEQQSSRGSFRAQVQEVGACIICIYICILVCAYMYVHIY